MIDRIVYMLFAAIGGCQIAMFEILVRHQNLITHLGGK